MRLQVPVLLSIIALFASPAFAGDAAAGKTKASLCAACHGPDGNSVNPDWPKLAGQHGDYIAKQTMAIKNGEGRVNALMAPMVANLSAEDAADIGAYFATQTSTYAESVSADAAAIAAPLYRGGDAARGIPACMSCHGPDGRGNGPAKFPSLRGQHAKYTATQLMAYRDGTRTTGPMMLGIAKKLEPAEIEALAAYLAALH
ncbi:MAG: cytochrome c4 [Gammaproteobacteria bacterium]|nr:cytochrome c4 [Gammaproteobacteria bacterium]